MFCLHFALSSDWFNNASICCTTFGGGYGGEGIGWGRGGDGGEGEWVSEDQPTTIGPPTWHSIGTL